MMKGAGFIPICRADNKKGPLFDILSIKGPFNLLTRRCPTLPHSLPCSTIGAEELNCRVRNGNGCDLFAIATGKFYKNITKIQKMSSKLYKKLWPSRTTY